MPAAWGAGLATVAKDDTILDTWFPFLGWGETVAPDAIDRLPGATREDPLRGVHVRAVEVVIDTVAPPNDATDVYLRLHLLSNRSAVPRSINLDGAFGLLTNVAWTNLGPVPLDRLEEVRFSERVDGRMLSVHGLDKFPRMTDYVVPSGVRIADADRVRLGAHLA
jgi:2,3,4,5-tetrahydropyridine-2,6-dicarboxylate N-succinyltransferase